MRSTSKPASLCGKGARGRRNRGHFGRNAGQSLVEVAFITPVLLLLALGVIELGRYMYAGILIGNAARAGASYGVRAPGDGPGIVTAACGDFGTSMPGASCSGSSGSGNHLQITSTQTCGCDNAGTIATLHTGASYCDAVPAADMAACTGHWTAMINVQASGSFNALFHYPGIPTPITITRTATMRVNP
jgi:Flp pilus assembly protein TadG